MSDGRNEESPAPDEAPLPVLPAPVRADTRRLGRFAPWIIAAVIVVLAAASAPYWARRLPWGGGDPALAQLLAAAAAAQQGDEARITALAAELQPLKGAAGAAASAASLDALADRVTALEQKQAAAAGKTANVGAMQDTLTALTTRLDGIEARLGRLAAQSSQQGGGGMLLVALDELRLALRGSGPYAGELAAVAALGHDNADIAAALKPLAADAAAGIPSTALLARRFDSATAPAIFRAAQTTPAPGDDWGGRILARLRALVVIHRIDGGGPTDTAIAAARHALAAGDLAGAAAALKPLGGAPAQAAAPWLALAGKRLAAEAALARISRQIAARVAGADP